MAKETKLELEFNLPKELLQEILIKLPAKSLIRFRYVCKSWNFLISTSIFIQSHLNNSNSENVLFKQTVCDPNHKLREIYTLHSDSQLFQQLETLNSPFKYSTIIGSVNGLVCLWDHGSSDPHRQYVEVPRNANSNRVILWNPSIQRYFLLPHFLKNPNKFSALNTCFGFGYDHTSKDYKVVRIVAGVRFLKDHKLRCLEIVKVFSLATKSWRKIYNSNIVLYNFSLKSYNVGNFVYFQNDKIVPFDLSSEVFGSPIAFPEEIKVVNYHVKLTMFRDSLALLRERESCRFDMWVMRDSDIVQPWSKVFSVDIRGVSLGNVVGFTPRGIMVVIGNGKVRVTPGVEDVQVVKYKPLGDRVKSAETWGMESFKESLVLLDEEDTLPCHPVTTEPRQC